MPLRDTKIPGTVSVTYLQCAWKPLPTLIKEQHTVLALSCAKRESTADASGRANTPSVITTAPEHKQRKRHISFLHFRTKHAVSS